MPPGDIYYLVRLGSEQIDKTAIHTYELQDSNHNALLPCAFVLQDLLQSDDFKQTQKRMGGSIIFMKMAQGSELRIRTSSEINTYQHMIGDQIPIRL